MNNATTSIISYPNAEKYKSLILKENKNKSGIYRWNNLINGSSYIGKSVNLANRLRNYYSPRFLNKELLRNESIISKALLKYGYDKFSLDILEYCNDVNLLIKKEQYYFDLFNPRYNILKVAGSRLGCKHSPKTLLKFKDRKFSPEALALRKINHLLKTGHITIVVNKENNTIKEYSSISHAARDLGTSHSSLLNYIDTSKLYKGIYLITRK